jgi:hypothetical protein
LQPQPQLGAALQPQVGAGAQQLGATGAGAQHDGAGAGAGAGAQQLGAGAGAGAQQVGAGAQHDGAGAQHDGAGAQHDVPQPQPQPLLWWKNALASLVAAQQNIRAAETVNHFITSLLLVHQVFCRTNVRNPGVMPVRRIRIAWQRSSRLTQTEWQTLSGNSSWESSAGDANCEVHA